MATDVRGHTAPAALETPRRQVINDLSLTINDFIPVANSTARAQKVTDLTAAGFAPSSSKPLYVHRGDVNRLEVTTNGTTWRWVGGAPEFVALPWSGSFENYANGRLNASVVRSPGRVDLAGTLTRQSGSPLNVTSGTVYTVGTLAAEDRPTGGSREFLVSCGFTTPGIGRLLIQTNGNIQLVFFSSGTWNNGGTGFVAFDGAGWAV